MKTLSFVLLPLAILAFSAPVHLTTGSKDAAAIDSTWLLSEGAAGKVAINMDVNKLTSIFEDTRIQKGKKTAEGEEYASYKIMGTDNSLLLEIETLCADICMVSRIHVYSERYKTNKNIGVGSTWNELKTAYTAVSVIGFENGGVVVYTEELPQMGFVFTPKGLKSKPGQEYMKTVIPGDAGVQIVYLY